MGDKRVMWSGRDRLTISLAWAMAAAGLALSWHTWLGDLSYPGTPWQDPHQMADFRDTIWVPGRWLLNGGNPYDPAPYLAANPGSQEFDPYAPAWLLLSAVFGLLPFAAAAAAYLALSVVLAVVMLRLLLRWASPSCLALGTPLGLIWLTVWSPGRYALQNGGTFLTFIGWVLVMRALVRSDAKWGAAGLALVLLKPQFGLPLVIVMLASHRAQTALKGLLLLIAVSAPVLVACVVAAGGPSEFVASIVRLVAYAGSPNASTGLLSPFNGRVDVLGLFGRVGIAAPGWIQLAVALAATGLACVFARRGGPVVMTASVAALVLLGLVHQPYDEMILVTPLLVGLPLVVARIRSAEHGLIWSDLAMWTLAALPVVHLHRVTTLALSPIGADLIDVAALALCVVVGTVRVTQRAPRTTYSLSMSSPPLPTIPKEADEG